MVTVCQYGVRAPESLLTFGFSMPKHLPERTCKSNPSFTSFLSCESHQLEIVTIDWKPSHRFAFDSNG